MTLLRDISFLWSMLHIAALYLLLFTPRCSWRTALICSSAGIGALTVINMLLMVRQGPASIMHLAFFTCTIPSLLLFFLLSKHRDGRFFFLFCLTDTMSFWLMQITNFMDRMTGDTYVMLFLSRLVLFPAVELLLWRYLRRPYLELQEKLKKGWWLFTCVGGTYYLLLMVTAVPVDAPLPDAAGLLRIALVLFLMPLTYLTIFHSLWRQMRMYENSRQMELQQRDYNAVCQKMELTQIYRHDMRHHLAALDELLQQGSSDGALQYVRTLNGGLESLAHPAECANSAVNAILTAYIVQAADAGCSVGTKISLPEKLPFEETDLCVILANSLENAIHACRDLPGEQRQIRLEMELTENGRLIISVENPCPRQVFFDSNGLPEGPRRENHGLGLPSIRAMADKYGGLFRCQWDAGRFILRVVLIPPEPAKPSVRRTGPLTYGILALLLCLILLNCLPPLTNALEEIPVLGAVVRVVDLRTYTLAWKDGARSAPADGAHSPASGGETADSPDPALTFPAE